MTRQTDATNRDTGATAPRQNATNDATRDTTNRDTVSQSVAARRLGVSLRTVQRRIENGDLSTIERDGKRLVCLEPDATEDATRRDKSATVDATEYDTGATNDATNRDSGATMTRHDDAARAELLAHLQAENEYLKSQVDAWRLQAEAANRTASETAAALRKALDAMPRAIEAPADALSESTTQRGSTPQEAPQSGKAANHKGSTPSARNSRHSREMRPLWKVILGIR